MASGVDAKLLKSTKFPPEFSKKIDMEKVNLEVMKQWISRKVVEILGSEDDVVIDFVFGMLEEERHVRRMGCRTLTAQADISKPDPKRIQLNLTGFLEKDTPAFCKQLWTLLLSAQANPQGVPSELLEAKKEELRKQKLEVEKAAQQLRLRREDESSRYRESQPGRRGEPESRANLNRRSSPPPPPPPERVPYRPRQEELPARDRRRYRNNWDRRSPLASGRRERRARSGGNRGEADTYIPSRRESYRRDFDDHEGRSDRYADSNSRSRSPRFRNGKGDRYVHPQPKHSSNSPEQRRGSRYSRSTSHEPGRDSRGPNSGDHRIDGDRGRRRSATASSYSETSSVSSRSNSRSSYESSRSQSKIVRKSREKCSTSSGRSTRDRPHKRSKSPSHKTQADDEKNGSENRRRHSIDYDETRSERDYTKRRRTHSPGEATKRASRKTDDDKTCTEKTRERYAVQEELDVKQRENLLRERLLREKIKRYRNIGSGQNRVSDNF